MRVYVDDILYIDEWHLSNGSNVYIENITVEAGIHIITIEYYESTDEAFIEYSLDPVTNPVAPTTIANAGAATATVIASRLNVRGEPNVFAPILTKVSRGETYPIVGQNPSGQWIQLNVNGTIGWVNETYTDEFNYENLPVVDETVVDVPDIGSYTATATANLNMRRGPGLEYDVIRIIPENTILSIEARTIDADWWQISYRGQLGWVTEAFLNVSPGILVDDVFVINP